MKNSHQEKLLARITAATIPVTECGCWLWEGHSASHGYGEIQADGIRYTVPRASWVAHKGSIPDGLQVLHRCDNPACANPNHLFLGTIEDNMRDKIKKGRWGGQGPRKLTKDMVSDIRKACKNGVMQKVVASLYGVHPDHIRKIINRKIWKDDKHD